MTKFPHLFLLLSFGLLLMGCGDDSQPIVEEVSKPAPSIEVASSMEPASSIEPARNEPVVNFTEGGIIQQPTEAQKSQIIGQMIHRASRAQAQGLAGGKVTVNGAWTYVGYSTLTAIENPPFPVRFVAVDVTVEGHNSSFDFDDIEIVDGADSTSYGSDAHITFLDAEGRELPVGELPAAPPAAVRTLLIFGFPEQSKTFTLYYWGQKLIEPMEIANSGWSLRYPGKK